MTTDIKVLKELVAIRLDVNIWFARKKLTPSDFGTAGLPPEKIASLGSKRICDPAELRIFGTIKSRAVSLLESVGVRFLGGWAVPEAHIPYIQKGLQAIAGDFIKAKDDFLNRYDDAVREWINDNPGWESIISNSVVNADYVRSRLGFSWQMFRVVPPKQTRKADVEAGLNDEVKTLGSRLFGEIAKAAGTVWHKSYAGKTEVTRKALSPLKAIHTKLSGLSFVEPRVTPVLELLDTALRKVPDSGQITGADLVMLQGLVCLLRDPEALIEHGQKMIEGRSPDAVLESLLRNPLPEISNINEQSDEDTADDLPMEEPEPFIIQTDQVPQLNSLGLW